MDWVRLPADWLYPLGDWPYSSADLFYLTTDWLNPLGHVDIELGNKASPLANEDSVLTYPTDPQIVPYPWQL